MTVVVTGAQGFIGRFVCKAFADRSERVLGVGRSPRNDAFNSGTLFDGSVAAPVPSGTSLAGSPFYDYCSIDVCDEARFTELLREEMPRAVIHLATPLRDDPWTTLSPIAIGGTLAVTRAVATLERPCSLVLGSSASVYGPARSLPVREDSPCVPTDLYGVAKYAAERVAVVAASGSGVRVVAARLFNVLGPGEDERHAPARFARQAVDPGCEVISTGDLSTTRDFIDVRDAADALVRLSDDDVPAGNYNVCSGIETAIQDVLDEVLRASRRNIPVVRGYSRPADMPRQCGDRAKLTSLGVKMRYPVKESVEALVAYYRSAMRGREESAARVPPQPIAEPTGEAQVPAR